MLIYMIYEKNYPILMQKSIYIFIIYYTILMQKSIYIFIVFYNLTNLNIVKSSTVESSIIVFHQFNHHTEMVLN